jgi:hypothetical protein
VLSATAEADAKSNEENQAEENMPVAHDGDVKVIRFIMWARSASAQ